MIPVAEPQEVIELFPGHKYLICGRVAILADCRCDPNIQPSDPIIGEDGHFIESPRIGRYGDITLRLVVVEKVESNEPEN